MKRVFAAVVIGLSALSFNATAHGPDKAQHGGIVQSASDLSFELVAQGSGASLYVVDHGAPADVSKMTGKLTVLNGTEKTEAELKPVGANKLEAAGAKMAKGAKVVATLSTKEKKTVTVRFTVR